MGNVQVYFLRRPALLVEGFTWRTMGVEGGMQTRQKKNLQSRGLVGDVLLSSRPRGPILLLTQPRFFQPTIQPVMPFFT